MAIALSAGALHCGSSGHPAPLEFDAAFDIPVVDERVTPTTDTPVTAADGASDAVMDGVADAATDGPSDAALDTLSDAAPETAVDAPVEASIDAGGPHFCGFTASQMNQLAAILAGCTAAPPQPMLTAFYGPDHWEGGPFAARPCDVLLCATTAATCNDVLNACLKYSATPVPDGGTCTGIASACHGTAATHCANGVTLGDDCEALGERCVATSTQSACAPTRGDPCSVENMTRCNGTVLEACIAGVFVPQANCALTGSHCDPTAGACVGTGASCTGSVTTCDGTSLVACRGGHQQLLDCGALVSGAACQTVGSVAFCGVGNTCDPTGAPPGGRCDGNVLVLCAGGSPLRFDCAANGFSACGPSGCVP